MSAHLFESYETQVIENRRAPRYAVAENGALGGTAVTVRNLSRTGAQLACPVRDYGRLQDALDDSPVSLELHLQRPLSLMVQPIYANRCDGHYLIGVRFLGVRRQEQAVLDAYIRTLL